MSIVDIKKQFIAESGGNPELITATMRYTNGGALQHLSFVCKGIEPIEVECPVDQPLTAATSEAVRLAKAAIT